MHPLPPWQPSSGSSVDRSLVYAFMRQESAFNPRARSVVGAMGLMQLMPATARAVSAAIAGDRGRQSVGSLSQHVSLGQAYISMLLNETDGNLVRTTAGYNGGPGNVMRWDNSLNASQDPLLYTS